MENPQDDFDDANRAVPRNPHALERNRCNAFSEKARLRDEGAEKTRKMLDDWLKAGVKIVGGVGPDGQI